MSRYFETPHLQMPVRTMESRMDGGSIIQAARSIVHAQQQHSKFDLTRSTETVSRSNKRSRNVTPFQYH